MWDQEGDARLTSSCVLNRLKQMGGSNEGAASPQQKPKSPLGQYSVEIVDDDHHRNQQQQLLQHQQQPQLFQNSKAEVDNEQQQQQLLQQQQLQSQENLQQQQEKQDVYQELYQDEKTVLIIDAVNT